MTPVSFLSKSLRADFNVGSEDERMYLSMDPAMLSSFRGFPSPGPPTASPIVFLGGGSSGGKRAVSADSLALFRRTGGVSGFLVVSKSWRRGWSAEDWLLTFLTLCLCCGGLPEDVVDVDLYECTELAVSESSLSSRSVG